MATNTFNDTTADHFWGTAGNWSLGRIPDSTDNVTFGALKTAVFNVTSATVASLTIPNACTLKMGTGATDNTNRTLTVSGAVAITGAILWQNAAGTSHKIIGTFTCTATTSSRIAPVSNVATYGNLTLQGPITLNPASDSTPIHFGPMGTGATMSLTLDCTGQTLTVSKCPLVTYTSGTGGTLTVLANTLAWGNPHTSLGMFNLPAGGTVLVTINTMTVGAGGNLFTATTGVAFALSGHIGTITFSAAGSGSFINMAASTPKVHLTGTTWTFDPSTYASAITSNAAGAYLEVDEISFSAQKLIDETTVGQRLRIRSKITINAVLADSCVLWSDLGLDDYEVTLNNATLVLGADDSQGTVSPGTNSSGVVLCMFDRGSFPAISAGVHAERFPSEAETLNGLSLFGGLGTGTLTLPAASNVWYNVGFGAGGTQYTGTKRASSITNCAAGNIKSGVTIDNVEGTLASTTVLESILPHRF